MEGQCILFATKRRFRPPEQSHPSHTCMQLTGRTSLYLHMNQSSLRNNLLKFKIFKRRKKKIPNLLGGFCGVYLNLMKENWKITTCDQLALENTTDQLCMPKNLHIHRMWNVWITYMKESFCIDCDLIE